MQDESDDGLNGRNGSKKARNGRPQREKTDKEDRDRQRQEAANKRKGRAERRRAEGETDRYGGLHGSLTQVQSQIPPTRLLWLQNLSRRVSNQCTQQVPRTRPLKRYQIRHRLSQQRLPQAHISEAPEATTEKEKARISILKSAILTTTTRPRGRCLGIFREALTNTRLGHMRRMEVTRGNRTLDRRRGRPAR